MYLYYYVRLKAHKKFPIAFNFIAIDKDSPVICNSTNSIGIFDTTKILKQPHPSAIACHHLHIAGANVPPPCGKMLLKFEANIPCLDAFYIRQQGYVKSKSFPFQI